MSEGKGFLCVRVSRKTSVTARNRKMFKTARGLHSITIVPTPEPGCVFEAVFIVSVMLESCSVFVLDVRNDSWEQGCVPCSWSLGCFDLDMQHTSGAPSSQGDHRMKRTPPKKGKQLPASDRLDCMR